MSEELGKARRVLQQCFGLFDALKLAADSQNSHDLACSGMKAITEFLTPAPEFEEVEVVRWLHVVEDRLMPEGFTPDDTTGFAKATYTIKRPIRRAVIREYEVAAKVGALGDVIGVGLTSRPFLDHPECHGKAGVLIFRTAE